MSDVKQYWIDDDLKIEDAGETTRRDLLARLSRDRARAFVRVVLSDDYDALRAEVERLRTALERVDYLMAQPQDDDTDPNEYRPTVTEVQTINVVLAQALRRKETNMSREDFERLLSRIPTTYPDMVRQAEQREEQRRFAHATGSCNPASCRWCKCKQEAHG